MQKKQYSKRFKKLYSRLNSIINIGVTPALTFEEIRKVRIINLIAVLGVSLSVFFAVFNFVNGRYVLSLLNTITVTCMSLLLYANHKQRYAFGHVGIGIILSVVFALSSLLYHNGMEFYLLIVTALLMTIRGKILALQITYFGNCILFLFLVRYGPTFHFFEPVPRQIYFFNVCIWMVFYILFFWYFKLLDKDHQTETQHKNKQLQRQQKKLIEQTEQLELSNRQLQVLNSTKEKLFSIVAHDVRSPIAGLTSTLDLFSQNILTKDDFAELSKELLLQLNQLHGSLDDLLKWVNSQMKGLEVNRQKILLEPLINDTLSLLQYNLTNKKIECIVSEGHHIVDADPDHVKLIMRNLISNAIKFSYAGSKIDLQIERVGYFIHASVADNGIGMSEDAVKELFSEISISSTRGTYNEKGTGMGLKISKEFAEKNGGSILVHCRPGEGCVFTLSIPAA